MRFLKWLAYATAALVLALGLFILGTYAYGAVATSTTLATWRGERDARRDLSRGVYQELTFGYPVPWIYNYRTEMEKRYNVHVKAVADCIVSSSLIAYVEAYDKVSTQRVIQHFGHDVFKETSDQVEAQWVEAHPKTPDSVTE